MAIRSILLHVDATHLPASLAAAQLARERGVIVSLDVDHVRPGLDELLALTDLCITSANVPPDGTISCGELRDLEYQ